MQRPRNLNSFFRYIYFIVATPKGGLGDIVWRFILGAHLVLEVC